MHRLASRVPGAPLLAFVALLWGTTFVVVKGTIATLDPGVLVLARFVLAAAVFAPLARRAPGLGRAGLELGALLWAGYASQAAGLAYTSASRSAFITALNVILVPMLAGLFGRRVPAVAWVSAALAFAGVGLLSNDGAPPNVGDLYTLVTAVTYAAYVLRLEHHVGRFDAPSLTAAQVLGVLPFAAAQVALAAGVGALPALPRDPAPWLAVLYLGLVATALTTWLQVIGQASVDAPRAAVIYTTEPVWAAAFAAAALGERLGPWGVTGAGLILLAVLLGQLRRGDGSGTP